VVNYTYLRGSVTESIAQIECSPAFRRSRKRVCACDSHEVFGRIGLPLPTIGEP
jgi:hypothetical protein